MQHPIWLRDIITDIIVFKCDLLILPFWQKQLLFANDSIIFIMCTCNCKVKKILAIKVHYYFFYNLTLFKVVNRLTKHLFLSCIKYTCNRGSGVNRGSGSNILVTGVNRGSGSNILVTGFSRGPEVIYL